MEQVRKAAADPKLPIHGITADFSSLDEVRLRTIIWQYFAKSSHPMMGNVPLFNVSAWYC